MGGDRHRNCCQPAHTLNLHRRCHLLDTTPTPHLAFCPCHSALLGMESRTLPSRPGHTRPPLTPGASQGSRPLPALASVHAALPRATCPGPTFASSEAREERPRARPPRASPPDSCQSAPWEMGDRLQSLLGRAHPREGRQGTGCTVWLRISLQQCEMASVNWGNIGVFILL